MTCLCFWGHVGVFSVAVRSETAARVDERNVSDVDRLQTRSGTRRSTNQGQRGCPQKQRDRKRGLEKQTRVSQTAGLQSFIPNYSLFLVMRHTYSLFLYTNCSAQRRKRMFF